MTPHDFNQKLLLAKDTALDTLEDLCAPAFPRRKPTPEAKPDGTPLTWDEKQAFRRAQPPPLSPDEQHLAIAERTQRMRAASTILKTRPIGEDGNPLPISRHHPQHHTRTTPRQAPTATSPDPTDPERERAGSGHRPPDIVHQAQQPTTNNAPDPTNPERERAGSGHRPPDIVHQAQQPTTNNAPDPTNPERQRAGNDHRPPDIVHQAQQPATNNAPDPTSPEGAREPAENDHRPINAPVPPSAAALSRSRCPAAPEVEQPGPDPTSPQGRERADSEHHPPSATEQPHHTNNQVPRPQPPPPGEPAG